MMGRSNRDSRRLPMERGGSPGLLIGNSGGRSYGVTVILPLM
jgi:hypothetical protein